MPVSQLGYRVLSTNMLKNCMASNIEELIDKSAINEFELSLIEEAQAQWDIPTGLKEFGTELDTDIPLPKLLGDNIVEHFEVMAKFLTDKALPGINCLLSGDLTANLQEHSPPAEFILANLNALWTRFYKDLEGNWQADKVQYPLEEGIVEDKETFVKGSNFSMPIISTAIAPLDANNFACYLWLSPQFYSAIQQIDKELSIAFCLGLDRTSVILFKLFRFVYFQRVSFNAQQALNEELVSIGRGKFVVNHNSAFDNARNIERYEFSNTPINFVFCTQSAHQLVSGLDSKERAKALKLGFSQYGSLKNLIDSHNLHVPSAVHPPLSKDKKKSRNIFVQADSLYTIAENLDESVSYAMDDVFITYRLWRAIWPIFQYFAPSKVVLAAHFLLASSLLPIEDDWFRWKEEVEQAVKQAKEEMAELFCLLADEALTLWHDVGKNDKALPFSYQFLDWTVKGRDILGRDLPAWYVLSQGGKSLTGKKVTAHYLLQLTWEGQYLYKNKELGWVYGPNIQIPHKSGKDGKNVGSVLGNAYLEEYELGILASQAGETAHKIMEIMSLTSYWDTTADRVHALAIKPTQNPVTGGRMLACAPFVVPHNTTSLRTGESTFLTLASQIKPKFGSELKSKIVAGKGTSLVYFDIDSEELQIIGVYGDSLIGISGATPLGHSLIVGNKDDKTDVHSVVSTKIGIARRPAKNAVYAACYGGEIPGVSTGIYTGSVGLSLSDCKKFAKDFIATFKGKRVFGSNNWSGGHASAAFNKMFSIVNTEEPRTPILETCISKAQWPSLTGNISSPSLLNWTVQQSGASFLHCIVVANWFQIEQAQLQTFLGITIHDEFVYTSAKRHERHAALLFQYSHLWAWSLLHYKLGIYDMPANRAYASGISIGRVLRKDPEGLINTPTYKGYASCKKDKTFTMSQLL